VSPYGLTWLRKGICIVSSALCPPHPQKIHPQTQHSNSAYPGILSAAPSKLEAGVFGASMYNE